MPADARDDRDPEVLILGGGPVGLYLALALTELGVRVTVIERGTSTPSDPRAAIVWPRVAEVLRAVGVVDRFEAAACRLRRAEFRVNGRYAGAMELGRLGCAHPYPLMIEQHETVRLLAGRLAELGVPVRWQTEALAARLGDRGVEVDARDVDGRVETLRAGWLAGCDGARSLVRRAMGVGFDGAPRRGVECLQVNASPTWAHPDDRATGYFFIVPGRTLLACPLPTGGYRFVSFAATEGDAAPTEPTLDDARDAVARATLDPGVSLAPVAPRWFNRARFQDRVASSLVRGRAVLAGDSAHVWTPIGGHGMNAGLRGAHNLAWKLAAVLRGEADASLLGTYDHEQRAVARAVIDGITRMKTEEPSRPWVVSLLAAVFPLALRWVDRLPAVEARLTELDAHHRGSPLSLDVGRAGALRAGDRVPDVAVRAEGRDTTVHALLSLRRWTLLALTRGGDEAALASLSRAAAGPRVRVVPVRTDEASARALGGVGRAVLVRPDDHVGVTAPLGDATSFSRYLARWSTRAAQPSR